MNSIKRTTASIALVALVSGIFSTGVAASSSSQIAAANALADMGYITDHATETAAYNLNQNVLRQEIAAVARGVAGLDKKTSCDNSFSDVSATTPNTWACFSVEALLDADLISGNDMFNPENEISKAEAVGMMIKAAYGDNYSYDSTNSDSWMKQVVDFAANEGIVSNFSNYDDKATRGFVFEAGNEAIIANEEVVDSCDEISQLLGLCGEEEEVVTEEEETTTEEETVVVSGDNVLAVELSPETPAGTDLPVGANGVEVLTFDVTAGSEDVSISAMEFERLGFGEAAADEVAVYTEEGRASKVKSFSDSDDMANVTFSPAVVVKAGETRSLTVKVNTFATNANIGEFAVSVTNITASSTVDAGTIVSNYFDVKDVAAAQLEITDEGVNSSVIAGEEQADIAEFKLTNKGNLSTDVDVTVTSITLKEIGTVDQEEVLENITLTVNGDVIATVANMDGKYITFNFDAFVIEDDKNETFTVKADIMGGAGDKVNFELDSFIDITAVASKYNAVNIVTTDTDFGEVTVDAGELTIYSIDAENDEIRQDKSNVILGQLKIVNVAGKNLELQTLGIELTTSNTGVTAILENVEFEVNGTSYDLDAPTGVTTASLIVTFSDTDLDILLPQGTTILTVRADTLDNLTDGTTIEMKLNSGTSNFRIEETDEDVVVSDITPSSLSWDNIEVVLSAAIISDVPLADVKVVKGATDLVALQFEIEAGSSSFITLDRVKSKVEVFLSGASVYAGATNSEISEVALYKGSVSESNLLDKISGSKLDTSGIATFDGFEVEIAADAIETFIVTVSTVDNDDIEGALVKATVLSTDVELEDDENDVVTLNTATISNKEITVLGSGILVLTADADNTDNEEAKTVLAGEETVVYSVDTKATNEEVNVETIEFTFSGALTETGSSLKNIIKSAKLYLDDVVVATATNSDILASNIATSGDYSTGTILFENISSLDFPTTTAELKLAIVTENIGYERIGSAASDVIITKVTMSDAEGVDSSEDVTVADLDTTESNSFAVVPTIVVASASNTFGASDNTASITFAVDSGDNTDTEGNNLTAYLSGVTIEVTSITATGTFTLTNSNSDTVATGSVDNNGDVVLSVVAGEVISNGEVYSLETTAEATFKLAKDGVEYVADNATYNMSLKANENLGSYDAAN